jgi:hypothetical protein
MAERQTRAPLLQHTLHPSNVGAPCLPPSKNTVIHVLKSTKSTKIALHASASLIVYDSLLARAPH